MYDAMHHAFAKNYLDLIEKAENEWKEHDDKYRKTYIPWRCSKTPDYSFRGVIVKICEKEHK